MSSGSFLIDKEVHALYFLKHLRNLPSPYDSQDAQRLVLSYFSIHGLAILGELKRIDQKAMIEWVYSHQVHPDSRDRTLNMGDCGFRGGAFLGNLFGCTPSKYKSIVYDTSHIASTYAALAILKTLGDDLSRVNKPAILSTLRALQNKETGGFGALRYGSEEDVRFVYCACAISYMLDDWSGINLPEMVRYLNNCINEFDHGIGMNPENESHGGAIFCAIGALVLSGRLMELELDQDELIRWLVCRQVTSNGQSGVAGFQGRCNKIPDSCYAYWVGGTLELLGQHGLVNSEACSRFIFSCQFPQGGGGGFCKYPQTYPDVMHSYLSLAWLSIQEHADKKTKQQVDKKKCVLMPLDTKLQVPFFIPSNKKKHQ